MDFDVLGEIDKFRRGGFFGGVGYFFAIFKFMRSHEKQQFKPLIFLSS